jgi:hypothetical protein
MRKNLNAPYFHFQLENQNHHVGTIVSQDQDFALGTNQIGNVKIFPHRLMTAKAKQSK